MVAIRSIFVLSAAVGIASAGKCKPESHSSSIVSVASSTVSASDIASSTASTSATVIESSITLADTSAETSLASTTETASSAASADVSRTESKPTIFLTSFTTSNADTTTEAATTTTTLAPSGPTCPSTSEQCAGSAEVMCDVTLNWLQLAGFSSDILECASFCDEDDECQGFSRIRSSGACFKAIPDEGAVADTDKAGWDSGFKYSCAT